MAESDAGSSVDELLERWHKEVSRSRHAHYEAARFYTKRNYWLGMPAVILSAIVGSTVFATLEKEVYLWVRLLVGFLSVVAGVLTALQTFLAYSARAEKHRLIAAKYGGIRRDVEVLQEKKISKSDTTAQLTDIGERMNALGEEAPTVPENIWVEACRRFKLKT